MFIFFRAWRRSLYAITLALLSISAWGAQAAAPAKPSGTESPKALAFPTGLWVGTVGKEPVRVCVADDSMQMTMVYWPNAARVGLLDGNESTAATIITFATGTEWRFWRLQPDTVSSWRGVAHGANDKGEEDSTRTAPIRLKRVKGLPRPGTDAIRDRYVMPCGRPFIEPFIWKQTIREQSAEWRGHAYARLINRYGETMALPVPSVQESLKNPHPIERVNQQLLQLLHQRWAFQISCAAQSPGNEVEKKDSFKVEPVAWSARWLAVRVHDEGYVCGMGVGYSLDHVVFDLQSGHRVDPGRWLRDLSEYGFVKEGTALAKWLNRRVDRATWTENIGLAYGNGKGLVFLLSHGGACRIDWKVCTREVVVPYSVLKGRLTPAGQRMMQDWTQPMPTSQSTSQGTTDDVAGGLASIGITSVDRASTNALMLNLTPKSGVMCTEYSCDTQP